MYTLLAIVIFLCTNILLHAADPEAQKAMSEIARQRVEKLQQAWKASGKVYYESVKPKEDGGAFVRFELMSPTLPSIVGKAFTWDIKKDGQSNLLGGWDGYRGRELDAGQLEEVTMAVKAAEAEIDATQKK